MNPHPTPDHFLNYWQDCHSNGRGGGLRTDRYFGIQAEFDAALDELYAAWYASGCGGWYRYRDCGYDIIPGRV